MRKLIKALPYLTQLETLDRDDVHTLDECALQYAECWLNFIIVFDNKQNSTHNE